MKRLLALFIVAGALAGCDSYAFEPIEAAQREVAQCSPWSPTIRDLSTVCPHVIVEPEIKTPTKRVKLEL